MTRLQNAASNLQSRTLYGVGFLAGALGALLMTLVLGFMLSQAIFPFSLEIWLGSFIIGRMSVAAWLVGFFWHVVNGGLFGMAYAAAFRALGRVSAGTGALLGIGHALVAAALILGLRSIHPMRADASLFTATGALGLVLLHVLFGAVVGGICRSTLRAEAGARREAAREPEEEAKRRKRVA